MDQKQKDDFQEEEDFLDVYERDIDNKEESEEKNNDVNEIINDDQKEEKTKTTKKVDSTDRLSESKKEESSENKREEDWNFDEDNSQKPKSGSTWKIVSGILLVLLIVAIYTGGFHFTGATALSQADAQTKVLDYVNSNLLTPPFVATVSSSEDAGDNLYKLVLNVAGQEIDSYVTKDGKLFFPQGFDLNEELPTQNTTTSTTTTTKLVNVSVNNDDPVKGLSTAPVTIVEFSDFECPYCGKYVEETYPQIVTNYVDTGKVKYIFKNFPLSFHPDAEEAALAAECAREQGEFWKYHDLLFSNQDNLSTANYKQWAADLGLDTSQFDSCLDSEKYKTEVEADLADGQNAGVTGTPAFFINGKLVSGAQPYSVFKQEIETALSNAGQTNTTATTTTTNSTTTLASTKEFNITAKKWRFDPNKITVNKGDKVKLLITSQEIDLNFILSKFNVDKEILSGETATVEFTADQAGTFNFSCGTYCTTQYGETQGASLKGELVVN